MPFNSIYIGFNAKAYRLTSHGAYKFHILNFLNAIVHISRNHLIILQYACDEELKK